MDDVSEECCTLIWGLLGFEGSVIQLVSEPRTTSRIKSDPAHGMLPTKYAMHHNCMARCRQVYDSRRDNEGDGEERDDNG